MWESPDPGPCAGLLIFCTVISLEILPNTCCYNMFETYLGFRGCLTQDTKERKDIYICVPVFGSKLQLKRRLNWPSNFQ